MLDIVELKKSYQQGKTEIPVLKNISFSLNPGERIAIVGKSGSGKSTLLSLLAGLDRPDHGEIQFFENNIFGLSENELAIYRSRNMGIIFQHFHLIPHLSALENISLPLEILNLPNAKERAEDLLEHVGLSHRGGHLPSELSGGEKQRVACARALATSPKIILADEPSGSLDEETGQEVMKLLFDLVEESERAMILVTHDMDLAKTCERVLLLEHGELREVN